MERHPRLADRVFTADELAYAARGPRTTPRGARFAAKEAAVKALGLRHFGLRDIEVVGGEPPTLRLHGRAADAARERGVELQVSLTHSQEMAAAVVVAGT